MLPQCTTTAADQQQYHRTRKAGRQWRVSQGSRSKGTKSTLLAAPLHVSAAASSAATTCLLRARASNPIIGFNDALSSTTSSEPPGRSLELLVGVYPMTIRYAPEFSSFLHHRLRFHLIRSQNHMAALIFSK
ncbi:hypothetical protein CF319_g8258 [Tilletia indica]|nr:hypothetical protein CF319_g8258 [Tilletia indica]